MSEPIVKGLFTLAGTLLGGLISYIIARNAKEIKTLKSQVNILSNRAISYWNLEELYSKEISNLISKAQKTVKQEYREKIEAMGLDRPRMTEKEVKKILTKNT
jgi:membrane protein YqaA with SNARE-associated domain